MTAAAKRKEVNVRLTQASAFQRPDGSWSNTPDPEIGMLYALQELNLPDTPEHRRIAWMVIDRDNRIAHELRIQMAIWWGMNVR